MNELATQYWHNFWESENLTGKVVEAGQFGDQPDHLLELVINGVKTATCYGAIFYTIENKRTPQPGDYSIILDSKDNPRAIIQLTKVEMVPMNKVTEGFAVAEGDGTYENWYEIHRKFFYEKCREAKIEFHEAMTLVCQTFQLVHVKHS
ncbi:ASCH domain-containing protein [Alkalihalobacillus sp. FSL W8-0930]